MALEHDLNRHFTNKPWPVETSTAFWLLSQHQLEKLQSRVMKIKEIWISLKTEVNHLDDRIRCRNNPWLGDTKQKPTQLKAGTCHLNASKLWCVYIKHQRTWGHHISQTQHLKVSFYPSVCETSCWQPWTGKGQQASSLCGACHPMTVPGHGAFLLQWICSQSVWGWSQLGMLQLTVKSLPWMLDAEELILSHLLGLSSILF